ncbi:HPr family phosphocarrier protein [Alicyclobacillus cycloheptanicus]|uniref:Phosphocarrier protein HPr n=1 Tax=Alicyclobacillus cycloheptanicus TaxID=1457 RepID=A0ABT9XGR4_9BACL|nr:HPr family phosphocarrier protein [Alicyclobacillus cycloheptanicus]MDQ0189489.1 phosphocarrier protein [Alicyclobacillus cycloheptanicus]WDM01554.1 HPr family phosphocarrier protein [Alicyclobacillus cycloheptanicus]
MERQVVLVNPTGLHARPASIFVAEANKFQSEVYVEAKGKRVNAKSILGLLTLALGKGTPLTIITSGTDEEQALNALCELVENGIGESTSIQEK